MVLEVGVSLPSSPSKGWGLNICKEFELSTEDTRIHARGLGILPIEPRAFKGRRLLLLFARLAAHCTGGASDSLTSAEHWNRTRGIHSVSA